MPEYDGGGERAGIPSARGILREPRTGSARWVLAVAVFGAVMGAALALDGVLLNLRWLPQAAFVVGGTLLIPALLRKYPVLGPYAPLGALAGWFMSLTLIFFPTTAALGVFPTTNTVKAALQLASESSTVITTHNTPVPAVVPIVFLICAGLGFAALLIDTLAITVAMPATSSLGLVLILLPAALTTKTGIGTMGFVGAGTGFLLILGCCRWYAPEGKLRTGTASIASGTLSKAAVLGGAVVLLMSFGTALIPGFSEGSFPQGSRVDGTGGTTRLDPMISLGEDLRSQSTQVSLTYLSNTDAPEYLRLSTLEDFTGKAWEPSEFPDGLAATLSDLAPALGPSPAIPVSKTVTKISIASLAGDWLPTPFSATEVQELSGKWLWNPSTQTFKAQDSSTSEQVYLVRSEMPALTPALLNAATETPSAELDPIYTQLPRNVPKLLSSTAFTVAGSAATPYAKAMALQDFLRAGDFTYSLSTPVAEDYDGSGMEVLAKFLEAKAGYCVHFSAAMAVMARELGIPSRIAVGYAPGTRTASVSELDGEKLLGYEATGADAHAWPELYFEGLGWVPFEPTPSRGNVPAYAQEESAPGTSAVDPAIPTEEAVNPSASPIPSKAPTATSGSSAANDGLGQWLQAAGFLMVILLLLAVPALARLVLRRRRLAQVRGAGSGTGSGTAPRSGASAEVLAWRELLAAAVDFGYKGDPALTPALHAAHISKLLGSPTPAGLALVLHAYEQRVYGHDSAQSAGAAIIGRDDLADAVEALLEALRTNATLWGRVRAVVIPASLIHRPYQRSLT